MSEIFLRKFLTAFATLTLNAMPAFAQSSKSEVSGLEAIFPLLFVCAIIYFIFRLTNKKVKINGKTPLSVLPNQSKPIEGSFIKRYWEGKISLPISYWIVSLGTGIFGFFLVFQVEKYVSTLTTFNPLAIFISMSVLYLALTVITIWQIVGVTRSSLNHINNPQKLKIWGILAIFAIISGLLQTVNQYQKNLIPQIVSMYKIAILSDPDLPSFKITVLENGSELKITGGIKHGLVKEVKKILSQVPSVTTINLESIGGRQGEAKDLYDLISRTGLNTVTNGTCLSACTIVFAAGKNRWIGVNGTLGLHSGSFEGMSNEDVNLSMNSTYKKIQMEKGIPRSFFLKGNNTSPDSMWYPTRDELHQNNFITSEFSPAMSSLRILEQTLVKNLEELRSSLPKKLDSDTTLVDVRIKLNNVTSTHALSKNLINRVRSAGIDWQFLRDFVIKNYCKSEQMREDLKIGIRYNYVYLDPETNRVMTEFRSPETCP